MTFLRVRQEATGIEGVYLNLDQVETVAWVANDDGTVSIKLIASSGRAYSAQEDFESGDAAKSWFSAAASATVSS